MKGRRLPRASDADETTAQRKDPMDPPLFELLSGLTHIETIAVGRGIRQLERLEDLYGKGRWRKMKGRARIRLAAGSVHLAEIHWYQAHGIGRRGLKLKRYLD